MSATKFYGSVEFSPEDGRCWVIEATPAVSLKLRRIFPKVGFQRSGRLVIQHTDEVARDLQWVLDRYPLEVSDQDLDRLVNAADAHRTRETEFHEILNGRRSIDYPVEVPAARPYQRTAGDIAHTNGRVLIGDDLGLGKTLSSLLVLRDPECLPALVVTLTHLPGQWKDEVATWFPLFRCHVLRGTRPYDPASKREMKGSDPDVIVTSYSKLASWGQFLAGKVRTVIFDECHELRRDGSLKHDAAGLIADQAERVIGLSATPVLNYGGEIFNIFEILSPGSLGSRAEFEREWCHSLGNGKVAIQDPAALGSWLREQGLLLRRTRKEVGLELPAVSKLVHTIESSEKVLDDLTGEAIDLAEKIVGGSREEAYVAAGEFDNRIRYATGMAKAPYVADFVRMLVEDGEKVVLFGWHHDVYEIWEDRLTQAGIRSVRYTGKESAAGKARSRNLFMKDGDQGADVLMMSLRSGAGLNGLQEVSSTAVFGELDWSPGIHDQCIGRLNRDGQQESRGVMAFYLVSQVGADPIMADVLNVKRQQAEKIRDPQRELFETASDASKKRIKDVARAFLAKRARS